MATVLVIQHVPHEPLGTLEAPLKRAGLSLRVLKAADPKAVWPQAAEVDGLVVMGGPQSVYEQAKYSYLTRELTLLREAVKTGRPVLGVCLGSQLLASALGAAVAKNPQKEIGWHPIMREPGADGDPLCEPFGQTETVFQWHGDTFEIPKGAARLFSAPLCENQAFRYGRAAYGLQFHVEITEAMIRAWLAEAGNKKALASLKGQVDPEAIRRQVPQHIARMKELSEHVAGAWASLVPSRAGSSARSQGRTATTRT